MFYNLELPRTCGTFFLTSFGAISPKETRPSWELHSEVTTAESRREHVRPPESLGCKDGGNHWKPMRSGEVVILQIKLYNHQMSPVHLLNIT